MSLGTSKRNHTLKDFIQWTSLFHWFFKHVRYVPPFGYVYAENCYTTALLTGIQNKTIKTVLASDCFVEKPSKIMCFLFVGPFNRLTPEL